MLSKTSFLSALACSLIFTIGQVQAADQTKDQTQLRNQDQIYGSQLMTEQERIEHRNTIRNLKTEAEINAFINEQHKKMQARAKEKGITLPDEPMMRSGGMGPAGGMRPGGGMGGTNMPGR